MQVIIPVGVPYEQLLNDLAAVLRGASPAAPAAAPLADEKLTIRQAAARLDVCVQTVHQWKRKGLLPFQKLGGRAYIKASDLVGAGDEIKRAAKPGKGGGRG